MTAGNRLLLIDVGNSRIKWAIADDGMTPTRSRAKAHGGNPAASIETIEIDSITAIRVANVTGTEHAAALDAALRKRFGIAPTFARSQFECEGLRSAYAHPERLGIDRWLCLLAAWTRTRGAVCVASCGTALTFDATDDEGQHLGGIIAPGLLTAQKAVLGATRFSASGPDLHYQADLGTDTEACVRQGALHACAGLLDRLAARHAGAAMVLTGGDAETLKPHLASQVWTVVPDLVLEGLLRLDDEDEDENDAS